jgi:hypothetical protein
MPASAAQIINPPTITHTEYLAVLTEIRCIRHLTAEPALHRILLVFRGARQSAEIAAEGDLLIVADQWSVEYQHRMIVDSTLDHGHVVCRNGFAQIDICDLSDKPWAHLPN